MTTPTPSALALAKKLFNKWNAARYDCPEYDATVHVDGADRYCELDDMWEADSEWCNEAWLALATALMPVIEGPNARKIEPVRGWWIDDADWTRWRAEREKWTGERVMAKKHLKLNSHTLNCREGVLEAWCYEENAGISVYVSTIVGTRSALVPWRLIRRALARKDRTP